MLQLYIKIHLCHGVTNNILRKKSQVTSNYVKHLVCKNSFFFFFKLCVKFPRNTIYVLVCLKDRVVLGNSSFCSAYLAFGWIHGPSAISVEMQTPVNTEKLRNVTCIIHNFSSLDIRVWGFRVTLLPQFIKSMNLDICNILLLMLKICIHFSLKRRVSGRVFLISHLHFLLWPTQTYMPKLAGFYLLIQSYYIILPPTSTIKLHWSLENF